MESMALKRNENHPTRLWRQKMQNISLLTLFLYFWSKRIDWDMITDYDYDYGSYTNLLFCFRLLPLLSLPFCLFNFIGLIWFPLKLPKLQFEASVKGDWRTWMFVFVCLLFLFICLLVYFLNCLFSCPSVRSFVCLFVCVCFLFVCMFVRLCVCICAYMGVLYLAPGFILLNTELL